jgi:hypothetical protein
MGDVMIRKILVAGTALAALAAFTVVSQPVEAGSCSVLSAKARGLDETKVSKKSSKQLTRKINHYAHKNKITTVHVGVVSTVCSKKGPLEVCKSSAKVCG